jgi:outer membrane protein OmpA-like peptidoglycan-associated protein
MSLLAGSGALVACHQNRSDDANADKGSPAGSANQLDAAPPDPESVKQSLEGLKPRVSALSETFTSLHKRFDALPPSLPGFDEVRARFYATDEGMGIMAPKLTWLSNRLDSALKSGNRDELQKVSTDIAATHKELDEIDRIVIQLTHDVSPFERAVRLQELEITGATPFTHVLPTSFEVVSATDGVEQRLIAFIEDSKRKVDKTTWFDFDHLHFADDRIHLDIHSGVSTHQLKNVLEILKAYPSVKLKIGGFTDNTGAPADNKKLSAERAQSVEEELVRLGVTAERLDAQGYGAEHPVCPANDTDACKSRNRRIAALVTAK